MISCATNDLLAAARCYQSCVNFGMQEAVKTYLLCQWANQSGVDPVVEDWVTRAGGGISDANVAAVNTFYLGLVSSGLISKMISVNVIAPDSLAAAITPLIVGGGNSPWTNHNFLSGDITVAGLIGNGTTKYLDTGIVPSVVYPGDGSDGGISWYTMTSTDALMVEAGCGAGANRISTANCAGDGNAYWDCFNTTALQGRLTVGNTAWAGFMSFNRTSTTNAKIYRANNANPWSQRASSGTGGGAPPNVAIHAWRQNVSGSEFPSSRRLSFIAIHHGLTSAEGQSLYNLVVALRTSFGGGTAP